MLKTWEIASILGSKYRFTTTRTIDQLIEDPYISVEKKRKFRYVNSSMEHIYEWLDYKSYIPKSAIVEYKIVSE